MLIRCSADSTIISTRAPTASLKQPPAPDDPRDRQCQGDEHQDAPHDAQQGHGNPRVRVVGHRIPRRTRHSAKDDENGEGSDETDETEDDVEDGEDPDVQLHLRSIELLVTVVAGFLPL